MAKSKKKQPHKLKRTKPLPPLSKADKIIYFLYEAIGAIIICVSGFGWLDILPEIVLKNPEVLGFQNRGTIVLIMPFLFTFLIVILDPFMKKKPIIGNKKVDYYNTTNQQFALPLFDERYKNISRFKERRKKFFKKVIIWTLVFTFLFSLEVIGLIGRHEFTGEGITTYSVFNNPIGYHSYDEVERYEITTDRQHFRTRGLGYTKYEIVLTVYLADGEDFYTEYSFSRDIYALAEIEEKLKGKEKTTDTYYLEEFIARQDFNDQELKALYELFDMKN